MNAMELNRNICTLNGIAHVKCVIHLDKSKLIDELLVNMVQSHCIVCRFFYNPQYAFH